MIASRLEPPDAIHEPKPCSRQLKAGAIGAARPRSSVVPWQSLRIALHWRGQVSVAVDVQHGGRCIVSRVECREPGREGGGVVVHYGYTQSEILSASHRKLLGTMLRDLACLSRRTTHWLRALAAQPPWPPWEPDLEAS